MHKDASGCSVIESQWICFVSWRYSGNWYHSLVLSGKIWTKGWHLAFWWGEVYPIFSTASDSDVLWNSQLFFTGVSVSS